MRAAILIGLLGLAAPAAAQSDFDARLRSQMQLNELRAQQQLLQQQSVAQQNELMALDARLRTEQNAARIQAQRVPPRLPQLPYEGAPPAVIDTSRLPSIPDAALADSNRRVQEIARDRR